MNRKSGEYVSSTVAGETVSAFIPYPLPPLNPPLDVDGALAPLLARAIEQLQLLEMAGDLFSSGEWLVNAFIRKEAVLSAQIEETKATLMDVLEMEIWGGDPVVAEHEEIHGYLAALNYARDALGRESGLPISMGLLDQAHGRLFHGAKGSRVISGKVRDTQNWIGGTTPGTASFVPPPPDRLGELLRTFEDALKGESELHPLMRTGLLHAHFETLHPYLNGNGLMGRLLISLLLEHWSLLSRPLLYLSTFLKTHRWEYNRHLMAVRTDGDWEGWLAFFLEGVAVVAAEAVMSIKRLHAVVTKHRARLVARDDTTVISIRLFDLLTVHPVMNVTRVVELLHCSRPAAAKALRVLESAGVLSPLDERKRNHTLVFTEYCDILCEGCELSPNRGWSEYSETLSQEPDDADPDALDDPVEQPPQRIPLHLL
ncbi:Fic family protein [Myxococcota bacterium]|nr:Fic family protein [Myxococcota bacterium]